MGAIACHATVHNTLLTRCSKEHQIWVDSLDNLPKRQNIDTRFGTWNIRSLYRADSLMTVSRELSRYR
jgi:hypothetical protein